ncbi:hypothetical protein WA158_005900 [Blastocystis sp. Blastoise]
MSNAESQLLEDKYLFTFQDETQLWISKEFIEKYHQFPFYDIIEHSDKYEDDSYYIDMLPFHIEKVIVFLIDKNMDFESLNLRDGYDIYKTLIEYSFSLDSDIQKELLNQVKKLFINYLIENDYDLCSYENEYKLLHEVPTRLNNRVYIGLFTPQRQEELLYYSLLIKMIDIVVVTIKYDYASNIPLKYIHPSNIRNIFPSLRRLIITVITHYKKSEILLNPNTEEYTLEYLRIYSELKNSKNNYCKYDYYSRSDIKKYKRISLYMNNLQNFNNFKFYHEKRPRKLYKLYKNFINEAIYTNDYSQVEIIKPENECTLEDTVEIEVYYSMSKYKSIILIKAAEEGVFDSFTTLSFGWIKREPQLDYNIIKRILTTHVFPNVIELIFKYYDIESFKFLFPVNIISMIDTIHIHETGFYQKEKLALLFDNLAYTHSIHIDGIDELIFFLPHLKELFEKNLISFDELKIDSSDSVHAKKLECFENYKQNIDWLCIKLNSDYTMSIEYLKWISNIFDDNNIITIHALNINLCFNGKKVLIEYYNIFENILSNLIPKASVITMEDDFGKCYENFFDVYTTDNLPHLKEITFKQLSRDESWISFIHKFYKCISNKNFPISTTIYFSSSFFPGYHYDPNTSIFRYKYDSNYFMDTINCTGNETMNKYEMETLFECINENKTQNIRYLEIHRTISEEQNNVYIQLLNDSSFIQENHVNYTVKKY